MSRGKAIALTALTAWPYFYLILALIFGGGFALYVVTALETLALLVPYVVFLWNTDRVRQDKKALWTAVLVFGGIVAMPVFWYYYIRQDLKKSRPEDGTVRDKDGGVS